MKKSWEVNSSPPVRTLKWMWTARPLYQPGQIVWNVTLPSASVTWYPRSQVSPAVPFAASSE